MATRTAIGSRPVMVRDNRRANAYIYGAICPCRRVGAALVMGTANTEAMNEHLKAISAQVAPGVIGAKPRADLVIVHTVPQSDAKKWQNSVSIIRIASVHCTCVPGLLPHLPPGAHAVLVCDGAGWHAKSKDIVVPANVTLVTLPAYSPELNSMENVWEFLRDNRSGAQAWRSYKAVVAACCDAWNWFISDAARIASIGAREWLILRRVGITGRSCGADRR